MDWNLVKREPVDGECSNNLSGRLSELESSKEVDLGMSLDVFVCNFFLLFPQKERCGCFVMNNGCNKGIYEKKKKCYINIFFGVAAFIIILNV